VALNRRCGSFHDLDVGVTQTAPKQRQNADMPPLTGQPHSFKPLSRIALIHRLTQLTLKSDSLGTAARSLEDNRIGAVLGRPRLDLRIHSWCQSLYQTQLSSVDGSHRFGIGAAQQGFPRPSPQSPQNGHQHEGGTTCKQLIHGF